MGIADGLGDSDYLIKYYIESAQALWAFDHGNNVEALGDAAAIICRALTQLSEDGSFWNALAALRGPIGDNQRSIREALDELDLFLSQEDRILHEYNLPESVINRLLSDLSLSLKAVRVNPDALLLERLRVAVPEATETICAVSRLSRQNAERGKILSIALRTREGLGILGGAVTIVVNGVTSSAAPIALLSIVGGAASSLAFLEWLRRKKG
jgi:hypothetical protein